MIEGRYVIGIFLNYIECISGRFDELRGFVLIGFLYWRSFRPECQLSASDFQECPQTFPEAYSQTFLLLTN